jgi:hypothetical protein
MDLSAYFSVTGICAIIAGGLAASIWEIVPLRPMPRMPFFLWSGVVSGVGMLVSWLLSGLEGMPATIVTTIVVFVTSFIITDLGQRRTADVVGMGKAISRGWLNLVPVVNIALLFLPGKSKVQRR